MKKPSLKIHIYSSKYLNIYHSSHHTDIKRHIEHDEKQNRALPMFICMLATNMFLVAFVFDNEPPDLLVRALCSLSASVFGMDSTLQLVDRTVT